MYTGPHIIKDGLEGVIDGGSWNRMDPTQTSDDYYIRLLEGTQAQRCFINDATTIPSTAPYNFGFGADRNTHIQIPAADGTFPSDNGPFDFSTGDGYTVDVWVMRTAFGTWQSGTTNYDGIWNYYWNHNLSFSGNHTGVNKIQGTGLSGYSISMDTWYNVIMTHDNTLGTNNHKIYINNNLETTTTVGTAASSRKFFVGNWDSGWSMVGNIPIIRVYNRPLTVNEVTQNWNSTKNRFGL
jgi:hypothetical protein